MTSHVRETSGTMRSRVWKHAAEAQKLLAITLPATPTASGDAGVRARMPGGKSLPADSVPRHDHCNKSLSSSSSPFPAPLRMAVPN
eukprot:5530401-Pyramimonas_sp.AAC.1